jgi:hypothetical protein
VALICFAYGVLYFALAEGYEGCRKQPEVEVEEESSEYEDLAMFGGMGASNSKSAKGKRLKRLAVPRDRKNSASKSHHSFGNPISIPFNISREFNINF